MTAPAAAPVRWETTAQAGRRLNIHPSGLRRAAELGELHGHQRTDRRGRPVPRSRWAFAPLAVDAWRQGRDIHAQIAACGCGRHLRAVPAAR